MVEDSKWSRSSTVKQITTPQMSVPTAASAHKWLMDEDRKWSRLLTEQNTTSIFCSCNICAHIIATLLITRL